LPEQALPAGITAVPVTTPRVVHRIELIHGTLRESSPAAELAAILSPVKQGHFASHDGRMPALRVQQCRPVRKRMIVGQMR
jgi:hypothetical protein